jgi:uncharacterized radical SAM superfamily Fe-S cluster-containing enzyme
MNKKLIALGVLLIGVYFFYNKRKKDQSKNTTILPNNDSKQFYTTDEANKIALEVVKKWLSMLDAIPKEALTEVNKNFAKEQQNFMYQNNVLFDKTLAEYVKRAKQNEFTNIYDSLKQAFVNMPKEQVDKLVPLLPKYLFLSNDDFKYFYNYLENNPFTLEEKLFLKDFDVESIFLKKGKDSKIAIGMR